MFTAAQAREKCGPTVEERVLSVGEMVRQQVEKDPSVRTIRLHDDFWTKGGYSKTADYKNAVALLQSYGYKVTFFYEERMCVDMYTIVSW